MCGGLPELSFRIRLNLLSSSYECKEESRACTDLTEEAPIAPTSSSSMLYSSQQLDADLHSPFSFLFFDKIPQPQLESLVSKRHEWLAPVEGSTQHTVKLGGEKLEKGNGR